MNNKQMTNDASFYWGICILRRLRDRGLLTDGEYEIIRNINANYYGTKIYVS